MAADTDEVVIECDYLDEPHEHRFPADWRFGGADGLDPRADPRFVTVNYHYFDTEFKPLWHTSTPLCDNQAVEEFTQVRDMGKNIKPYVVRRVCQGKAEWLPWLYDHKTDLVEEWK